MAKGAGKKKALAKYMGRPPAGDRPDSSEEEREEEEEEEEDSLLDDEEEEEDEEDEEEEEEDEEDDVDPTKRMFRLRERGDDESDEDEDAEDDEDEAPSKKGAQKRTAWGKKAKGYYADEDELGDEDDEDEADLDAQVQEAAEVQRERLRALRPEDFGLDELGGDEEEEDEDEEDEGMEVEEDFEKHLAALTKGLDSVKKGRKGVDTSKMSAKQKKDLLSKEAPDLQPLLKECSEKVKDLRERVAPLIKAVKRGDLPTSKGLSFLEVKVHVLLSYLLNLSYYLALKARGVDAQDHPVIDRLVFARTLMEKLRPIEERLKPQIDRLIERAAAAGTGASPSLSPSASGGKGKTSKPRVQELRLTEEGEGGESEEDEEDGDDGSEDEEEKAGGVYKAPKMMAVEFTGDPMSGLQRAERDLARQRERLKKTEMVRALREEFSEAPEEIGGRRDAPMDAEVERLLRREAERQDYEEENLTRLQRSKREKKLLQKAQEGRKATMAAGGLLLEELEDLVDVGGGEEEGIQGLKGRDKKKKGKETKTLGSYLNAIKQMEEQQKKASALRSADADVDFVRKDRTLRVSKRQMAEEDERENGFGRGDDDEAAMETERKREAKRRKQEERMEMMKEKAKKFVPKKDEQVEGRRATTYQIERNKGLTRKRDKTAGNARVTNRKKFEKRMKSLKGVQQEMREGTSGGGYAGEETGIRTKVAKSRKIT
uniref:Sas10 C-terminal domain-containing protein n=1 Tax=Chromera velia CCMP2878 TaxID=1169474 RepID=A0A0G4I608_9ALVE|mmetsp:Transcript_2114/g.4450  ORF Transcript_2114/g.4450 Transcript_2114/m.4450 type:complete len:714 (+) Transcript_2114:340-2481(+)|eukprot:Cvel_11249.t1-p1 / transcript=Cvel_11249.t1 / gene=Cvel_11249 / organism=Chromera_velia_CCMP2878 / gene_product=Neuroguidin, putative / transcript_product=Neuroguidin, putative / location=Cvel_scaffold701:3722-12276(+) / protein_length=713 / sequence_SO=supercontig / SO=protein_coding / is_pseudo=false